MKNSNGNSLNFHSFVFRQPGRLLFFIWYFILIVNLSSLIFLSCSKDSTKPETVTFSGTVTLEGKTDHSGVKVSLYKPVVLDTALVRINQQYPNIGVQISQETEFDHREHTPVYTTTTNSTGHWQIDGVNPGTYNVVAENDSFGWMYVYSQISGNVNMSLKKAERLSGSYSGTKTFENAFIEIEENTVFDSNSQIYLEGKNFFIFNSSSNLTINGTFNVLNNASAYFFKISDTTTAKIIFENQSDLKLENVFTINNMQFLFSRSITNISNSIFKNENSYAIRTNQTIVTIQNSIFKFSYLGCITDQTSNSLIEKNIFVNNTKNLEIFSINSVLIRTNYFGKSQLNLNIIVSDANIEFNVFYNSTADINISDISNVDIRNNSFINSERNIRLIPVSHQNNQIEITVNNNNFIDTDIYAIEIGSRTLKTDSLNAINNYWGTTSEDIIQEKIYDGNDVPLSNEKKYVKYKPFSFSELDTVGIIGLHKTLSLLL